MFMAGVIEIAAVAAARDFSRRWVMAQSGSHQHANRGLRKFIASDTTVADCGKA